MYHSHTGKWLLFPVVLIALLVAQCALAQETTAGVQGTVKDPSGALVAGATVEVASPALIGGRKIQTDTAGNFRFAALPPGDYTLTVTSSGFRTYKQAGIALSAGRLPSIEVRLEVGTVAETIEVSGEALAVDVTQSKVAVSVDRQVIDNLPKGRSFQSLIPFAAGARAEPMQGGRYGGRDNGYQIDGASDSENVYLIDGVNVQVPGNDPNMAYALDDQEAVPIYATAPVTGMPGLTGKIPSAFTVPTIGMVPRLSGSLSGLKELRVPASIGSFDLGKLGLGSLKISMPSIFA